VVRSWLRLLDDGNLDLLMIADIWIARWMHRPLPDDGRTPIEILLGEDGLIEFTTLVARIAAGTYR
jgi:hypothetical protein